MVGKILGQRYEIIEKIGGGGMALVYKARCQLLNRYVAIKILRSEFVNDKDLLDKFKQESQAAASLSHPNIVNIYDVGEEDKVYYIVMEYVKGKTLKELIKARGKLTVDEIIDFAKQIALALQHAHSNHIIHRDIKPHNILVTEDGRAKVTDFGIALAATSSTIINTGNIIGSVHYFAPEQARGGYTDEKSDLYSLGIVMYEMATGRLPFEGDAPVTVALKHIQEKPELPSRLNPSISRDLEAIIMKLIQKEQSARYPNTRDLIEDLYKVKSNIDLGNIDNTLKIEDSPTQVIPSVTANEIKELINSKEDLYMEKKSSNENKNKGRKRKFIIGSAIVSALLMALLFTFGYLYFSDFFRVEDVEVPNFVGQNIREAEKEAEARGLRLNVSFTRDSKVAKDEVVKQDTPEGMVVRKNTIINLTVNEGSGLATVPYLVSQNAIDAERLITNAGLVAGIPREEFDQAPLGTIISQSPEGGQEVSRGTEVNYVVSKGPKPESLAMPNLVGRSLEEAKNIINESKLELGNIEEKHSDSYANGFVMEQGIPANEEVEVATVINLTVSKGSDAPEQNEELNQQDQDQNQGPDTDDVSTRILGFSLSDYSGEVEVIVEQVDGNKSRRVYKKKHDLEKDSHAVSVPVTGTGRQKYAIYVNGSLFGTKEIDF